MMLFEWTTASLGEFNFLLSCVLVSVVILFVFRFVLMSSCDAWLHEMRLP